MSFRIPPWRSRRAGADSWTTELSLEQLLASGPEDRRTGELPPVPSGQPVSVRTHSTS